MSLAERLVLCAIAFFMTLTQSFLVLSSIAIHPQLKNLVVTLYRGDKDVSNGTIPLPEQPLEIATRIL